MTDKTSDGAEPMQAEQDRIRAFSAWQQQQRTPAARVPLQAPSRGTARALAIVLCVATTGAALLFHYPPGGSSPSTPAARTPAAVPSIVTEQPALTRRAIARGEPERAMALKAPPSGGAVVIFGSALRAAPEVEPAPADAPVAEPAPAPEALGRFSGDADVGGGAAR